MKKNILLVSFVLIIAVGAVGMLLQKEDTFDSKYDFAIIETTQSRSLTHITYYDEKMHIVNHQTIPYSEACDAAYGQIPRLRNNVYLAPTDGDYEGKNDVVVISTDSGAVTVLEDLPDEVDLDKNIAVDNNRIYVNSNLDDFSYLYAMSHDGKKAAYVSEPDSIFGDMVTDGESIFVASLSEDFKRTTLIKYRCDNLKIEHKRILEKREMASPFIVENKIYYISNYGNKVNLGCVDKDLSREEYITYEVAGNTYKVSNIEKIDNMLLFVLYKEGEESILCGYNLSTGKKHMQFLQECSLFQIECRDNYMYAISYDVTTAEGYLYRYSLNKGEAVCDKKWNVYSKKGKRTNYYIAGFFLK